MFNDVMAIICPFLNFLLGPWAWLVGVFAFAMAGVGILSEEAKLGKVIISIMFGLGIILAGPKLMDVAVGKNIATAMCLGANGVQR